MRKVGYNFDLDDRKPRAGKIIREILIWVVEIALVILLARLLIVYGVEKTTVVTSSMEPTLSDGDKIIINKMIYRFTKPKRFDVIVFKQSGKEHSYYTVKRIIGLPGETVEIRDGAVCIDGRPLDEGAERAAMMNGGLAEQPVVLDENEYFVLGDNRNDSEDSRFANIGNILREDIIGKAWIRLKPFDFISQIKPPKEMLNSPEQTE